MNRHFGQSYVLCCQRARVALLRYAVSCLCCAVSMLSKQKLNRGEAWMQAHGNFKGCWIRMTSSKLNLEQHKKKLKWFQRHLWSQRVTKITQISSTLFFQSQNQTPNKRFPKLSNFKRPQRVPSKPLESLKSALYLKWNFRSGVSPSEQGILCVVGFYPFFYQSGGRIENKLLSLFVTFNFQCK